LLRLEVSGFQSYREPRTLRLEPDLTLLAGRNDVGKSALLRALRLYIQVEYGAARDARVTYVWSVPASELLELVAATVGSPGTNMEESAWGALQQEDPVELSVTWAPSNWDERYQAVGSGQWHGVAVALPGASFELDATGSWRPTDPVSDTRLATALQGASNTLGSRVSFLAPRRPAAGPLALSGQDTLEPDASNLTSVVDYLANNERHTRFAALETFMHEAFPEITNIQVTRVPGSTPLHGEIHVVYGGREDLRVPLRYCGTGVEQLLALSVGILTAKEPRLFLVDEPQAFLHPHAERSLLSLFMTYDQHQFVVATHSGVFLNSRPISQARLITMPGASSEISHVGGPSEVLDELGVTAADLWLPDVVLWVEGPTEVEVLNLLRRELGVLSDVNASVRPLPGAARFASGRQSDATFRFVEAVAKAVSPRDPGLVRFLFDRDEKSEAEQKKIVKASQGKALFLPVREIENLFLRGPIIGRALREVAAATGGEPPTDEAVQEVLDQFLADEEDGQLFRVNGSEAPAAERVKGSEVLKRLYWNLVTASYDKVRDGARLAEIALEDEPGAMEPLVALLRSIETQIRQRVTDEIAPAES
jgi:energy-coupling factor transporter ATP-binding protein EcfA2